MEQQNTHPELDWSSYEPSGDDLLPGEQDAHDAWVAEGKPRCGERD